MATKAGSPEGEVVSKPWWTYPLLCAAVLAVGSAATVFKTFDDVPVATLASWRLQLVVLLLLPGFVYQLRSSLTADQRQLLVQQLPYLLASGLMLGLHFYGWVWSVKHTSLTHALLFVSASPLILAFGALLLRLSISWGEIWGSTLGLLGGVLLALDQHSDTEVTAAGDAMALLACLCFVGYISVGRKLREWMPLFIYVVPVTGVAAGVLGLAAMVLEGDSLFALGPGGVLGWLDLHYLPRVAFLAVGPGIVGHTGFNLLLAYLHPLAISLPLTFEPLIGSLLGWCMGYAKVPGWLTWTGGGVLILATAWVTVAGYHREREALEKEAVGRGVAYHRPPGGGEEGETEGDVEAGWSGERGRGEGQEGMQEVELQAVDIEQGQGAGEVGKSGGRGGERAGGVVRVVAVGSGAEIVPLPSRGDTAPSTEEGGAEGEERGAEGEERGQGERDTLLGKPAVR